MLIVASSSYVYAKVHELELKLNLINPSVEYFDNIYFGTHTRLASWVIGLMLGYIFYDPPMILLKQISTLMEKLPFVFKYINGSLIEWIIVIPSILVGFIAPSFMIQFDNNVAFSAITHSICRPLWSFAVCMVIVNCVYNRGKSLEWFLSLSIWRPLVTLNYSIYLIHVPLITFLAKSLRTSLYVNSFTNVIFGFGIYGVSVLIAIPMYLLIEMPCINLEVAVTQPIKNKKD